MQPTPYLFYVSKAKLIYIPFFFASTHLRALTKASIQGVTSSFLRG